MKKVLLLIMISLSCLAVEFNDTPLVYNWSVQPNSKNTYHMQGTRMNGDYIIADATLKSDESFLKFKFSDMHTGAIEYVVVSLHDTEVIRMNLDEKFIYTNESFLTFREDDSSVVEKLAKAIMAEEEKDPYNTLLKFEFYDWNDRVVREFETPLDMLPQYSRGGNTVLKYVTKGAGGIK